MRELYELARQLGVRVPIFHNDVAPAARAASSTSTCSRSTATRSPRSGATGAPTRARSTSSPVDEAALDAHGRTREPRLLPRAAGRLVRRLGRRRLRAAARAARRRRDRRHDQGRARRARARSGTTTCSAAATTCGYLASPDVYSSYDYGAPIGESGRDRRALRRGARAERVRRRSTRRTSPAPTSTPPRRPICAQHFATRARRATPLRVPAQPDTRARRASRSRSPSAPSSRRGRRRSVSTTARRRALLAVSPELPVARERRARAAAAPAAARALALLEREPAARRATTTTRRGRELSPRALEEKRARPRCARACTTAASGCAAAFDGALDRLVLDARHCWSVWIDGALVASGDQLRNPLGVGADGARARRDRSAPRAARATGETRDRDPGREPRPQQGASPTTARNPRGVVSLDTGATRVRWRFRGGLVRGERGLTPLVDFAGVERAPAPRGRAAARLGRARPRASACTRRASASRASIPSTRALSLALRPRPRQGEPVPERLPDRPLLARARPAAPLLAALGRALARRREPARRRALEAQTRARSGQAAARDRVATMTRCGARRAR